MKKVFSEIEVGRFDENALTLRKSANRTAGAASGVLSFCEFSTNHHSLQT